MVNISVRLLPRQIQQVDEAAAGIGLDRGRWLRAAVFAALAQSAEPSREPKKPRDPKTNLWITRPLTTVRHLRGLLRAFENAHVDNYAPVEIVQVDVTRGVQLPNGGVVTHANLPPEGIVFIPND